MKSSRSDSLSNAICNTIYQFETGQHKYINEFIKLNLSAVDMLKNGIFPDAKEITESYGMFNAVHTKIKSDLNDPSVTLVSVGDGKQPRTATLFAFRTKWECISIDPGLNTSKISEWEKNIRNLKCIPDLVENVEISRDKVIIVATHSHAPLPAILSNIKGKVRSLVAMPCCIPYNYEITHCIKYRDAGVWSPKNEIKVWKTI